MVSLKFTTTDGSEIEISPDTFLVFIDETGEEKVSDPNHPLFGLGGCCVIAKDYNKLVDLPWKQIKADFFNGIKILHANKLDLQKTN